MVEYKMKKKCIPFTNIKQFDQKFFILFFYFCCNEGHIWLQNFLHEISGSSNKIKKLCVKAKVYELYKNFSYSNEIQNQGSFNLKTDNKHSPTYLSAIFRLKCLYKLIKTKAWFSALKILLALARVLGWGLNSYILKQTSKANLRNLFFFLSLSLSVLLDYYFV